MRKNGKKIKVKHKGLEGGREDIGRGKKELRQENRKEGETRK